MDISIIHDHTGRILTITLGSEEWTPEALARLVAAARYAYAITNEKRGTAQVRLERARATLREALHAGH